jgi:DNA-binding response OmpR family regulator
MYENNSPGIIEGRNNENKVLLIEDSKLVQQMYKNKLLIENFEVITADNGIDGIKILV